MRSSRNLASSLFVWDEISFKDCVFCEPRVSGSPSLELSSSPSSSATSTGPSASTSSSPKQEQISLFYINCCGVYDMQFRCAMSLVSTWMGDRLGTPSAVVILFLRQPISPILILTFSPGGSCQESIQPFVLLCDGNFMT